MLEGYADKIVTYLVANDAAKEEDREVIAYGLFHIMASVEQIIVLAIFALITGMMPEILVFSICFTSLKRLIGGSHANSHFACLCGYTGMAFAICFVCNSIPMEDVNILSKTLFLAMVVLVVAKAPVQHPNNPLSAKKSRLLRKKSLLVAILQALIIWSLNLLFPEQIQRIALCGAAGGLSAAITLLLPIPQ